MSLLQTEPVQTIEYVSDPTFNSNFDYHLSSAKAIDLIEDEFAPRDNVRTGT